MARRRRAVAAVVFVCVVAGCLPTERKVESTVHVGHVLHYRVVVDDSSGECAARCPEGTEAKRGECFRGCRAPHLGNGPCSEVPPAPGRICADTEKIQEADDHRDGACAAQRPGDGEVILGCSEHEAAGETHVSAWGKIALGYAAAVVLVLAYFTFTASTG